MGALRQARRGEGPLTRCPGCASALAPGGGACASCGGLWLRGADVEALAPGRLAALRRLAGKGPLTRDNCADCGFALKSLDVPGHHHEGDLFWGLESPRPAGTCVAHACARCGGAWLPAAEVARAGGAAAAREGLARVARGAS